jgi:hypothetical protein
MVIGMMITLDYIFTSIVCDNLSSPRIVILAFTLLDNVTRHYSVMIDIYKCCRVVNYDFYKYMEKEDK